MKLRYLYDLVTGPCLREINCADNSIYLTFDDGPDPVCTEKVLSVLKKYNAKATFFVIGNKAEKEVSLIKAILEDGHTIGDHTIDHNTKNYFKSESAVRSWLAESHEKLKQLQIYPVAFRSPVGIKTPPLNKVLKEINRPLVLWSVRFYDSKNGLTRDKVQKKLACIKSGSIILVHDTHQDKNMKVSLDALEFLITECQKRHFTFKALTETIIKDSFGKQHEA